MRPTCSGGASRAGSSFGLAFPIATQTPNQTEPTIAFGAGHWCVAWVDDRFGSGARQIRFGLTDSAKFEAPNPATVAFAVPRAGLDQGHPSLVYDGANFNLFWDESRGGHLAVMGARFTAGGAFIDTFTVSGGAWNQYEPTAAVVLHGHVLVAWTDSRVGPTERDIWLVDYLGGAVAHGPVALAHVAGVREEHPSIGTQGDFYAVVAYETSTGGLDRAIESETIGNDIDSYIPYHQIAIGAAGHTYQHPSLVGNGQDMMLASRRSCSATGPRCIGRRRCVTTTSSAPGTRFRTPSTSGSYTPANPVIGSAGYDYVEHVVDAQRRRPRCARARPRIPYESYTDPNPTRLTNDPIVDTPGAVAQGQSDRLGLTYLRAQGDATWNGLQLFGGDARDTLVGKVVINEFLAHPASDRSEFYELFNTSGHSFFLNGWKLRVEWLAERRRGLRAASCARRARSSRASHAAPSTSKTSSPTRRSSDGRRTRRRASCRTAAPSSSSSRRAGSSSTRSATATRAQRP